MTDLNHNVTHTQTDTPTPASVLVIDDELAIREAIEDILDLIDVSVIAAANGKEGIELFTHWQGKINMILLDMQMPVMSGEETYRHLRDLDASIPIVLSSGYGETEARDLWESGSLSTGNVFFLRKPYTVDALLDLVQKQIPCGSYD
ncbi:MAG: response regulator [Caldilineaceae bacterium]